MQKSKIEWCDYTINPVKGLCPIGCPYCYARAMYKRFKWNPAIRYESGEWYNLPKTPSRIFVGSTMELFGDWVQHQWLEHIFYRVSLEPQHTFIFLTKQPQNLKNWSPFPENCWVGVSVTTQEQLYPAVWKLSDIECNKRFLSFEPLLEPVIDQVLPAEWDDFIDWVIIGQQTPVKASTMPKIEWIQDIVDAADNAGIPVFLKNNLFSLVHDSNFNLLQEFP